MILYLILAWTGAALVTFLSLGYIAGRRQPGVLDYDEDRAERFREAGEKKTMIERN
jgi:hypothetical protein